MKTHQQTDDEAFSEQESFSPLSAAYLLERGYCCGNGCKNCPYNYKNVPSPRREQLLELRKKQDNEKEA